MTIPEYEDILAKHYPVYRAYLQSMPYPRTAKEREEFDNVPSLEKWVEEIYGIKRPMPKREWLVEPTCPGIWKWSGSLHMADHEFHIVRVYKMKGSDKLYSEHPEASGYITPTTGLTGVWSLIESL